MPLRGCALSLVLSLPLPVAAQGPSGLPAWAELPVQGGVVASQASSQGKLCVYRDGTTVWAHSAATRRWTNTTVSGNVPQRLTNDCLLVMDGNLWSGFAAVRGEFVPLAVSANAQLGNPSGQNNDAVLLVHDGASLHAFSGFRGEWVTRPVGAAASWAVGRNVALLLDGNRASAMDAFTGTWHDLPVPVGNATLSADGSVALVRDGGLVHAFSANRGSWQSAAEPPGATLVRDDDWAVWFTGSEMLGFSGQQGRFEHAPLGASALVAQSDHFGVFATIVGPVPFSATRAAFGAPLGAPTATLTVGDGVVLCSDGAVTTAWSPLWNTLAAAPAGSGQLAAAGAVAVAVAPNGRWSAYSAMTGQWHQAPLDVTVAAPLLATTGALFATSTGLRAFSARSGAFVPLTANAPVPQGNPSSAILAAYDATGLHAFDGRTDRWRSIARPGGTQPPVLQIWRTTLQAIDGQLAFGFGAQAGTWATTPLPELFAAGRANSESGRLLAPTRVLAFAALGELTGWPQFPQFRRVFTAGSSADFTLPLGAGDAALLALGWPGAPQVVPGFGELLVDPGSAAVVPMLAPPTTPFGRFRLTVPAAPVLRGSHLTLQPLLLRGGLAPYLADAVLLSVW